MSLIQKKLFLFLKTFVFLFLLCFNPFILSPAFPALPEPDLNSANTSIKSETPFQYEVAWAKHQDFYVLALTLKASEGNYTYAPNQADVYPTELSLNLIDVTKQKKIQEREFSIPILYPVGVKKLDPFTHLEVYTYENIQNIFILFDTNAFEEIFDNNTYKNINLNLSFLACSALRCQPIQTEIPLITEYKESFANITGTHSFSWDSDFKKLFEARDTILKKNNLPLYFLSNQSTTGKPNKGESDKSESDKSESDTENTRKPLKIESLLQNIPEKSKNKNENFTVRPFHSSLEVGSIYKALIFGVLAGFILNFMPCVLPVIALKLRSFMPTEHNIQENKQNQEITNQKNFRNHNIFFSLGIITWFLILGLLLALIGLSWGQIFQNPHIVLVLLVFIFAMSLSLFRIFHLPILGIGLNTKLQTGENKSVEKYASFFSGLLATLLATPCSGPLLGAVLGYSLTQSLPILLTIFFSMGFGMALPYILFAFQPKLIRFMPKSGKWLHTVEPILGFLLVATSIYLLSLLPNSWHIKSLIILLVTAISLYIWGKWGSYHCSGIKKAFVGAMCTALIVLPSFILLQEKDKNIHWNTFSKEGFESLLGEEILVLKFTADWCPTCKVLEQTVFTKKNMQEIANEYSVEFIYVDLTEFNEEKQKLLASLDSVSIPLLAVFPKGNSRYNPVIIRDLYTFNQLKQAIEMAKKTL